MVNNHITLLHILAFHIIKGKKSVFHTYLSKHYSVLFSQVQIYVPKQNSRHDHATRFFDDITSFHSMLHSFLIVFRKSI